MWENEFRYLSQAGAGLMELTICLQIKSMKMNTRTMTVHALVILLEPLRGHGSGVAFQRDYTKVSDPSYFNDFDNKYGSVLTATQRKNSALAMRCKTSSHRFNQAVPGLQRAEHQ